MSIVVGGGTPEARVLRRVFPEEVWINYQKGTCLIVGPTSIHRIQNSWSAFHKFLQNTLSEKTTNFFEMSSVYFTDYVEVFIKAYRQFQGIETYRFALPLGSRKFETEKVFPLSSGAIALTWDTTFKTKVIFSTPEYALESILKLDPSASMEQTIDASYVFKLDKIAPYHIFFDYRL